ncbi:MAG: 16S rRNA (cytosine(1402)-N(4))-methyltransferase [Candidatus Niyogibacteria bacterium RIFCSPLOWO2_01_FULL_45_48]|uniref:Ribosomal RNA small subunit methyltransferase H n=2 Tax=Candidatus Niyogiibacteriota TaxID=1817912 RepID=A0A1G2F0Y6_9BACT|nr:MAG: 16S rRNA (cytosine(1402)-N(4))-methyltransferase [Candidatus Niyogibacteria bacterium RIFCSPLOWO2_01_FULL_45_48]OGZ30543.1 MAG: 16S rRNA (cytosine(1402)-N(4))-methyltransferase [Candidatus Niyogibacteria bacterium RIFCSPHIGHO2_01_FULL_45_28]OGZ31663.1 MAG: 16S rRNA (cytosine(1402)-N(4))-methyltransferase [Candidatus Niyogibacteria bacterium RIFCSPLOWO2_02_FULL_45_13]
MAHIPVLLNEAIKILEPERGRAFIDSTANGGGHTAEILKRMNNDAVLVAIDRDEETVKRLKHKFSSDTRLKAVCGNFRGLSGLVKDFSKTYDGILFDLGMSSDQLERSGRGFSFLRDEPLIMTFESTTEPDRLTAARIVNSWSESDLTEIFREYGEERYAPRIAGAIVKERKRSRIMKTAELAKIILEAVPKAYQKQRIHPATRTFQALRIAVNDELGALENGLREAWSVLEIGGRLAVISFHSLEDRIVKNFFRNKKKEGLGEILTKKPIVPDMEEARQNPRSRSSKLRALLKAKND